MGRGLSGENNDGRLGKYIEVLSIEFYISLRPVYRLGIRGRDITVAESFDRRVLHVI